jgi:hypothetical protein
MLNEDERLHKLHFCTYFFFSASICLNMVRLPEPPATVGSSIPAHTPHAVSVMFPTWQDNIYYEEGNPIVTSKMECGYPRFFIHPFIQQVIDNTLF